MGRGDEFGSGSAGPESRGGANGAGVIDRLTQLELDRRRAVHAQYEAAADLLAERTAQRKASGIARERWETGIAGELALALRMSPQKATRFLNHARELTTHMPRLLDRLRDGHIAPEAVPIIISGLAHLAPVDRSAADETLCGQPEKLAGMGLRRLRDLVQQVAYDRDRHATVDRIAKAAQDRRVTIRPEPDAMARVSILLPVAQAVGIYAALKRLADGIVEVGEELRTRGQVMADEAFNLITGRSTAQGQPVAVNLTIPATVLLGGKPGTATIDGGGSIPTEVARNLVARAAEAGVAWVKRLYIAPDTGAVVAMDSRSRTFPTGLADAIAARDQYCRTPYCDAPIAHIDHVTAHHAGGATSFDNGQGLCAACNYAKEGAGWSASTVPDPTGRHTVDTTTPTGHTYRSTAPTRAA